MKKQEVFDFYLNNGYEKDRYGNLCKSLSDGTSKKIKFKTRIFKILYKFTEEKINAYNETQVTCMYQPNEWIESKSFFYSKVKIVNGKISNKGN